MTTVAHSSPRSLGVLRVVRLGIAGLQAAWRAPAVIANGLAAQLVPPPLTDMAPTAEHRAMAAFGARAAHGAVARLARGAPARWRNSCLYRSVAECLVLRGIGLPARVVIGVGSGPSTADPADAPVIAHAWVECAGIDCLSTRGAAELEAMSVRSLAQHVARTGAH